MSNVPKKLSKQAILENLDSKKVKNSNKDKRKKFVKIIFKNSTDAK